MENRTKYPRSWHLPYSEKEASDDKKHTGDDHFIGKNVIVSIKMDGENTTIYNDHTHSRSLNSLIDSEDRRWMDALRKSKIENNIPNSFRICGENLFYKHTCCYEDLKSMFYAFSMWDGDKCLSWDETIAWSNMLGIETVPVIYNGVYNKDLILEKFTDYIKNNKSVEGFVIRLRDEFPLKDFEISLSKYVRKSFVIPDQHWKYSKKTLNKLKNNTNPWSIV